MHGFENTFVFRKAAEAEARIAAEKARKAQVWKEIQAEHKDLAAFLSGVNAEFGKLADSEVVLNGETVIEGKYHAKSEKPSEARPKGEGEKVCRQCARWTADKIGDGTGVGECGIYGYVREGRVLWPDQVACKRFEKR